MNRQQRRAAQHVGRRAGPIECETFGLQLLMWGDADGDQAGVVLGIGQTEQALAQLYVCGHEAIELGKELIELGEQALAFAPHEHG